MYFRQSKGPTCANSQLKVKGESNSNFGDRHSNPLQYFLPGKFHGQRHLAGYTPLDRTVGYC